jgi:hypothetical protein
VMRMSLSPCSCTKVSHINLRPYSRYPGMDAL